jgi:predicted RNase H-like HicB family nuclease
MKIDVSRNEPVDHYSVRVEWSVEDKAFIAWIPELPGCMSDGRTRLEAIANLADAQSVWLSGSKESGNPAPMPKLYNAPAVPAVALSNIELALLRNLAVGQNILSSDRPSDRAKTKLKKVGYIHFERECWKWVVTDAGRLGLRHYASTPL